MSHMLLVIRVLVQIRIFFFLLPLFPFLFKDSVEIDMQHGFRNYDCCSYTVYSSLTFKNHASYIQDGRTATLQMLHFISFFSTTISTEYFKRAAHSPFFSSKCRLFHNATFFGSFIIHILQGVLKFKCKTLVPKG